MTGCLVNTHIILELLSLIVRTFRSLASSEMSPSLCRGGGEDGGDVVEEDDDKDR